MPPHTFRKPIIFLVFIFLLVAAAVNFYLVFLLSQVPVNTKQVRVVAVSTACGILGFLILLISLFIFSAGLAARLFGFFSLAIVAMLGVVMGLDFAIPPVLKHGNNERARLFAIIAALFGTLLFIVLIIYYSVKIIKVNQEKKRQKQFLQS